MTYNIIKSPGDGHCFVHSVAKSWFSQLPDNPCFNKDVLLVKIKKETYDNAYQYVDYIDGDGLKSLYSGANNYIIHKLYNTSYRDIVPYIMFNDIHINFVIVIYIVDCCIVQSIECMTNNRPTIILLKSGEHFDAITPNVHNTPIYSALQVNRTENDNKINRNAINE